MGYWRDEIGIVTKNHDPIPFAEAVKGTKGKRFVFVHPTVELSEHSFRRLRSFIPLSMVYKMKNRRIILTDKSEMIFLTEHEIENNALRGMGKVIWVA